MSRKLLGGGKKGELYVTSCNRIGDKPGLNIKVICKVVRFKNPSFYKVCLKVNTSDTEYSVMCPIRLPVLCFVSSLCFRV